MHSHRLVPDKGHIMSSYLKLLIITYTLVLSGCVTASDSISDTDKIAQCTLTQNGKLNIKTINSDNADLYAYLLYCATLSVVPFHNESKKSVKNRIKKKQDIASFFISKKVDMHFKDSHGSTLIMSIAVSNLSTDWKLKSLKKLISMGSDVNAKNKYGKSALDLAKFKNNQSVIKLLSSH